MAAVSSLYQIRGLQRRLHNTGWTTSVDDLWGSLSTGVAKLPQRSRTRRLRTRDVTFRTFGGAKVLYETEKDKGVGQMFERLIKLFTRRDRYPKKPEPGMITRTCKICGKTFTLPENVQHWPDCCQECRAKYRPVETITRKCRKCGKTFTFRSNASHWPKYCPQCRNKRSRRSH